MSEDNENTPSEIELLKSRADLMGIKYHPNIGVKTLAKKIEDKQNTPEEPIITKTSKNKSAPVVDKAPVVELTKNQKRIKRIDDRKKACAALVRVNITCMNPQKSELEGSIISVGSAKMGTYKRFVPFNVDWHIPQIMLDEMKASMCTIFQTVKGPNGEKIRRGKLIPEYSIHILPALTEEELKELANQQARSKSIG